MPPLLKDRVEILVESEAMLRNAEYDYYLPPSNFCRKGKVNKYEQKHLVEQVDLLALGNSALGTINDCVYINDGSVQGYITAISTGDLPVNLVER